MTAVGARTTAATGYPRETSNIFSGDASLFWFSIRPISAIIPISETCTLDKWRFLAVFETCHTSFSRPGNVHANDEVKTYSPNSAEHSEQNDNTDGEIKTNNDSQCHINDENIRNLLLRFVRVMSRTSGTDELTDGQTDRRTDGQEAQCVLWRFWTRIYTGLSIYTFLVVRSRNRFSYVGHVNDLQWVFMRMMI